MSVGVIRNLGSGNAKPTSAKTVYLGGDNTTTLIDEKYVKYIFKVLSASASNGGNQTQEDKIVIDWNGYTSAKIVYYAVTSNANYGYNINRFTVVDDTYQGNGATTRTVNVTDAEATFNASVYAYAVSGSVTNPRMWITEITLYP